MFKRYELHNHTTQSDASITCAQLVDIMAGDEADVFAITDHNTVSGHRIIKKLLDGGKTPLECVYGMEYTTYYGHILCLNLGKYVPWDMIDRHKPELLFEACRAAGALTGIAHPFSYGDPFARGCRFEMTVHDYSSVDFIEIFNNSEKLHEVNERGILWWEDLTLAGERLAVTAGMDLHNERDMSMKFATYLRAETGESAAQALERAIKTQKTWISNGALLDYAFDENGCLFTVRDAKKKGFVRAGDAPFILTLRDSSGTRAFPVEQSLYLSNRELFRRDLVIPKLYDGEVILERLVCVAPVLRAGENTPTCA